MTQTTPFQTKKFGAAFLKMLFAIRDFVTMPRQSQYLSKLPDVVPDGVVLVHNHVRPTRRLGSRGFRAWLSAPDPRLEVCGCGWARELGRHFRVASLDYQGPIERRRVMIAAIYARKSTEQHGVVDEQKSTSRQVDPREELNERESSTEL